MDQSQVDQHPDPASAVISPGKMRRMDQLCDGAGRFAMLAVDQRTSLERMLRGGSSEGDISHSIRLVKRVVTESVAPKATALLTDPEYGYPHTLDILPNHVGLILSVEVSGYTTANRYERRSSLLDDFSVKDAARIGADAVKLLIYHNPQVSGATEAHQDDIVRRVGQACAETEIPFVLEIVTYGLGIGRLSEEYVLQKPDLVLDGVARYSDSRYHVDLFKVQFPADLKFTEEYQNRVFARGQVLFDRQRVVDLCRAVDAEAGAPWVILSAGVEPEEFVLNVTFANEAGASGFLCGRAVWKDVVDLLPDVDAMRQTMRTVGARRFENMRSANSAARPWFSHKRFRERPGRASDANRYSGRTTIHTDGRDGAPQRAGRAGRLSVGETVRTIIDRYHGERCLLAVCPNSEAVTKAAMEAAREADAPLLYAATLNQIDTDKGYTGWTPSAFADFAHANAREIGYDRPFAICLDHGGPWLKDQHTVDGLSLDESMTRVKASLEACIEAGYSLLHIDPTIDRTRQAGAPIPVEVVVERTLDLITHAEDFRRRRGLPPIDYEVGTEEVHGGLADMQTFDAFLEGLDRGLRAAGLGDAWPCFVVGKVGTDLDTDYFEPAVARRLTERVLPYGALVKGHYTDYVKNPEDYPISGMGGANVGPEFTEEEYRALSDLLRLEEKLGRRSCLQDVLRRAVISSGRWRKWLRDDESGRDFESLSPDRKNWLLGTCSRYIWTAPDVREARIRLYENVRPARDADAYVRWRIRTAVLKYLHAFNLIDFHGRSTPEGSARATDLA